MSRHFRVIFRQIELSGMCWRVLSLASSHARKHPERRQLRTYKSPSERLRRRRGTYLNVGITRRSRLWRRPNDFSLERLGRRLATIPGLRAAQGSSLPGAKSIPLRAESARFLLPLIGHVYRQPGRFPKPLTLTATVGHMSSLVLNETWRGRVKILRWGTRSRRHSFAPSLVKTGTSPQTE